MLFSWCEVDGRKLASKLSVEMLDLSKSCDQCSDSLHGMDTHEIIQTFMATSICISLC